MDGHYSKCLLRSVLAGMCIGVGGCVYIGCDVKWVGAVLFSIGLFTILTYKLDLYTGKVGYAVDNPPSYVLDLLVIIVGNFIGTLVLGLMMPLSGAEVMVDRKLETFLFLPVLFKGVLCGILMFIAADTFKAGKGPLATFVCVPVFILAGFEHSIADMFYFCSAGVFTLDALAFIAVVILGNAIGGMLIPFCRKYMYEEKPEASRSDDAAYRPEMAVDQLPLVREREAHAPPVRHVGDDEPVLLEAPQHRRCRRVLGIALEYVQLGAAPMLRDEHEQADRMLRLEESGAVYVAAFLGHAFLMARASIHCF